MKKLQAYPRSDGSHVPRPFEIWFWSLIEKDWNHQDINEQWFLVLKRLICECGCHMIHDPRWHWRESVYRMDWDAKGPCILVGGKGLPQYACTAALHELGHHLLCQQHQTAHDDVKNEQMAWQYAAKLATEHRLPFVKSIKKEGLHSYKYHKQLELHLGSKTKRRRRKPTTSDRLAGSRKTSGTARQPQLRPLGRKGKRHFKRELRRMTARAERRKGFEIDE